MALRWAARPLPRLPVYRFTRPLSQSTVRREDASAHLDEASHAATTATEDTTGEIRKGLGEFLLYYSGIFIPSGQYFRFIPRWLYRRSNHSILEQIKHCLPPGEVEITEFIPREHEGGAFVKFRVVDHNKTVLEAQKGVIRTAEEHAPRWWQLGHIMHRQIFEVRGRPWIEDLHRTFTSTLRVTFNGPDLTPEQLYYELRRYGRIVDIDPPSPSSKDMPRSAVVKYFRFLDASAARNCANMLKVGDTTLYISFVPTKESNPLRTWLVDHPRISIPILIALIAGLAYLIFEPIRLLSISVKVNGYLNFRNYPILRSISDYFSGFSSYFERWIGCEEPDLSKNSVVSWGSMNECSQALLNSLQEGGDTFNVITGPKGSGKERLVEHVLRQSGENTSVLHIDCDALYKTKSDNDFLAKLSSMLGYWPVFLWTNNISRFVDLAAQSLSGQNSGFSETTAQQTTRMLNTAATAISLVALSKKPKNERDTDYLQQNPSARPIVVISGYKGVGNDYVKQLATWAGNLVQSNAARVVFVTQDARFEKTLCEALPNRVLNIITVSDASMEAAKRYIIQSLQMLIKNASSSQPSDTEDKAETQRLTILKNALENIDKTSYTVLEPLGGRLSDLQAYIRRLQTGEEPCSALDSMISSNALEIEQMFLNYSSPEWTSEQVWVVLKKLAGLQSDTDWLSVPADLSTDTLFNTSEKQQALKSLEYRELLELETSGGELFGVKAGKPLYHAAFQKIASEPVTSAIMDIRVLKYRVKEETTKINGFENELKDLALLPQKWEITKRQSYLMGKLYDSQVKIELYEKQAAYLQADLKKRLSR